MRAGTAHRTSFGITRGASRSLSGSGKVSEASDRTSCKNLFRSGFQLSVPEVWRDAICRFHGTFLSSLDMRG